MHKFRLEAHIRHEACVDHDQAIAGQADGEGQLVQPLRGARGHLLNPALLGRHWLAGQEALVGR